MTTTDTDLIEFVRSYREPVMASEAATELVQLGNIGADWPRASYEHWRREFERLVCAGLLLSEDGRLSVPIKQDERPKQGTLF